MSATPSITTGITQISPRGGLAAAIGGLLAMAAGLGIGRFVYTPILPPMAEALGLTKSAAGLIASANFLGYLAGALLAATPILPGSRRACLLTSLTLSAVTTGAMGLTTAFPLLLGLRFVGGLASALVLVMAAALVLERLAAARRVGLTALHFAGVGVGIAGSACVIALLLQAHQSWRMLWLTNGGLSLAAAVAVGFLLPHRPDPPRPAARHTGSHADPALRRLVVAYGLFGFGYVITATFLVAMVRGTPSVRSFEPIIWVLFGLAACPSVLVWTRIAARRGIPRSFAIACVVEALGVLAGVVWPNPIGIVLTALLVGGTFMGLTALGLMHARALAIGDPRHALALMTGAFGVGQIIGPGFAGMAFDQFGSFTLPSLAAAGALLLAAALSIVAEIR